MNRYAEHLQGMVQIPTVSYAEDEKIQFSDFKRYHEYLEKTYPRLHQNLERKIIGRASLLYRWKGRDNDKLPLLLMGHQDVVPEGDPARWSYPPYSGEIAEECVWGRGSTDCKCVIMAEMEAVEALIEEGFCPDYDVYLAYGYNEEVQAPVKGAKEIVEYLKEQGVRLGCVFDEGGGITAGEKLGFDGFVCQVHMGEKAYQDYELYQDSPGGHSMEPGQGTALGAVARAIVAVEENPLPYRLTKLTENQLKALSRCMTGRKALVYGEPREYWEELCAYAREDKGLDALLHTTCAVTMASGSSRSNILPEHAGAIVNCRLLEGDTKESLTEHFQRIISKDVKVRRIFGEDPQPAASVEGRPFALIREITEKLYGQKVLVIPGLLAGGTDSRYYGPICDSVFRYSGFFRDERWGEAHQTNERIPCDCLESAVKFYRELLLRY